MRYLLLILIFLGVLFSFIPLFGQGAFGFGAHPNNQGWKILNSPAINVIYPSGMESRAQRVASIINHIDQNNFSAVGSKKLKLDVVMQNRTVVPNGYVGLAPARSEFFCTPPQSNMFVNGIDWIDGLAIHEFRHVQQFANTRYGATKLVSIISGQQAWSIITNVSVPNWFWEGDAINMETSLTSGGRGRAPFFFRDLKVLAYDGKDYSYQKIRNGSFKDFVPDHYRWGYLLINEIQKAKGNDITAKIWKDASAFKGWFYPFSRAVKRHVGYTTPKLYEVTWEENKKSWSEEIKGLELTSSTTITKNPKKTVTYYRFPRFLSDGSIVTNKHSYKKTQAIYQIDGQDEKEITTVGISMDDDYITVGNDIVAWNEFSRDGRRENLNYSDIVLYNVKSQERKRLTKGTRYFSPVVSPQGNLLAAIHISYEQTNEIHILNPQTGDLIKKLANPQNYFLSRLAWVNENELITIARNAESRLALVKFNLNNNAITELTPWSYHLIEGLSTQDDNVYFTASYTGIDNVFRTNVTGSKQLYQVTSTLLGAYEPDISKDGKTLVFVEYNSMGSKISKMEVSEANLKPYTKIVEPAEMEKFATVSSKSEGGDILRRIKIQNYNSKPYNSLFRGMKLHTWAVSPSFNTPSVQIQMNNILNDVAIVAGGGINRNERGSNFYNAELRIGRFFTETSLKAGYNQRNADFYVAAADSIIAKSFNEGVFGARAGLPLEWVDGNFTHSISISGGYNYRSLNNIRTDEISFGDDRFGSFDLALSFSSQRRFALQNVGPRLGIAADFQYTQSTDRNNEKLTTGIQVFLPGLAPNHNIRLRGGYQKELLNNPYQYDDIFEYPRGFVAIPNDQFTVFSVNYGLPLFYPDYGIKGITYFKRIRANLFYDTGIGKKIGKYTNYSSAGFEIIFDNVHLNFAPLSFGVRQAFLLEGVSDGDSKSSFTFFVATSL